MAQRSPNITLIHEKNDISVDIALLDRIRENDTSAYTALFKKYWRPLYQAAFQVLRDEHRCEDIIQEVFMQLWDKRQDLHIEKSLNAYLYAIVRHKVFFEITKNKSRKEVFENLPERLSLDTPDRNVEYSETVETINGLIAQLPQRCKEVYILSREKAMSHKQIAEKLGISTKTVENQLTKALKPIRFLMKNFLIIVPALLLQISC
ncbi:RNA polymerase sigma-70 factor [Sphingobacterium sp. LRF_L2]|uniref:RNA polymerase sigma-70 factor n=1 Tax=Sphingobacterium sp. LRF_L2 TaxID=3369421 RepID=UPI003F61F42F